MEFLKKQADLERLAEDILTTKQLIIDLDRRRNDNRVAIRSLSSPNSSHSKSHFLTNGLFLKLPTPTITELLKQDQQHIDAEIERLREEMKGKTRELEVLEKGRVERMRGFELKGVREGQVGRIIGDV